MPKLYTQKELESLKGTTTKEAELSSTVLKPKAREIRPKVEYTLLHPDTTADLNMKGKFVVEENDNKVVLEISGGRVKTNSEAVKDKLIKIGFEFLHRKDL